MERDSGESDMSLDERVSAAIDNELSADECRNLIDELGSQPEMQHAWERFHTIDAMLRGDDVAKSNSMPWDRIHGSFEAIQPSLKGGAKILDFESLKQQFATKWIGGAALAASVVLGVSLFVALQQPGSSMQGQYAAENATALPMNTDVPNEELLASRQAEITDQELTDPSMPEPQLVSDKEPRQSPIPPTNNRSTIPPNQPNRDLVRLVSDK